MSRLNKNPCVIMHGEDWEGLYINEELVEEGHTLNEGYKRITYFQKLAKKYNFDLECVKEFDLTDEEIEILELDGSMMMDLNEYEKYKDFKNGGN